MADEKSITYGIHAVLALLTNHPEQISALYMSKQRRDAKHREILQLAKNHGIKVFRADRQEMDDKARRGNHQGIIALSKDGEHQPSDLKKLLETLKKPPFLLVLDSVQDPHNLGACLRSALAAGVDAVIVPKDNAVGLTATVSKVACGAAEIVPFYQVTNLARTLKELQDRGIWVYGAAGEASKSLYHTDLNGPLAIVMGAEEKGLRRLTRDNCDGLMSIPMAGEMASLNVSVATGICLFEALRQRKLSK